MVMSTSKRPYSNCLSLSGNSDTCSDHPNNYQYSINNNIPRFIKHSSSPGISNSFKISKRRTLSSTSSLSPSSLLSSTSLLYLNRCADDGKLNTHKVNDSDFDDAVNYNSDAFDIASAYRNNNYFHFNSDKRNLIMNRPSSFSYPCNNSKNSICNNHDHGNSQSINSLIVNNDDLESYVNDISNINMSKKNHLPKADLIARERCFDYIVQAIDEVWARYCDTTSSAEVDMYDSWNIEKKQAHPVVSNTRITNNQTRIYCNKSIQYSDDEQEDDQIFDHKMNIVDGQQGQYKSGANIRNEEDEDGYKTEVTEYETDSGSEYRTVSKLPDSVRLESLKLRLSKAKNDLEQVYDSMQLGDSIVFWKRWDMIKYSAIEVMEDDDDDEVVEEAIKELEDGRYFHE